MTNVRFDAHYNKISRVLWLVFALNWAVAGAKIVWGMLTKSASITADGFHSLSDGTSNIIGLIGIRYSSRPVDADHPYGHKKYETLFSMGIAVLLAVVAFNIAKEGVIKLFHPVAPEVSAASFVVMLVTLTVNIFVMRYEHKRGTQLKSDILLVDSLHTRADIFTSLSVVVALIGVWLGFPILDPLAAILISAVIAYAVYEIIRKQSGVLCDAVAITDPKKIEDIVLKVKGVKSCHKIRTRGRPDDIYIDLHVQLEPDTHLDDAHNTSYEIEGAIKKEMPEVADVLVHLEPKRRADTPSLT